MFKLRIWRASTFDSKEIECQLQAFSFDACKKLIQHVFPDALPQTIFLLNGEMGNLSVTNLRVGAVDANASFQVAFGSKVEIVKLVSSIKQAWEITQQQEQAKLKELEAKRAELKKLRDKEKKARQARKKKEAQSSEEPKFNE